MVKKLKITLLRADHNDGELTTTTTSRHFITCNKFLFIPFLKEHSPNKCTQSRAKVPSNSHKNREIPAHAHSYRHGGRVSIHPRPGELYA